MGNDNDVEAGYSQGGESANMISPHDDTDNEDGVMEEVDDVIEEDENNDDDDEIYEKSLQHLKQNYKNPSSPIAYLGVRKLYYYYNEVIPMARIKDFLSKSESFTLMSPERRSRIFDRTFVMGPYDLYQLDLIDVSELAEYNENIKFLICVIDCFTKISHVATLENKQCGSVVTAINEIIHRFGYVPRVAAMDKGGEFNCAKTKKYFKDRNVKTIFSQGTYKCGIVERYQLSLQRLIYTHLTEHETLVYLPQLQELVRLYNSSYHRAIGMAPFQALSPAKNKILRRNIARHRLKDKVYKIKPRFKIGDIVRLSLQKNKFHRGYNYQNTMARYIVRKICVRHIQPCYYLKSQKNEDLEDRFYAHELKLTNIPTYRSTVIKTKKVKGKTQHLLHFKGYSSDYDEWVAPDQLDAVS